jgi:3-mercaptopyruvate sulfurtransferase SseA
MDMNSILAKIALSAVLLQSLLSADELQDPPQDYAWDCPASGFLPFRRDLLVSTEELARLIDSSEVTVIHVGFEAVPAGRLRRASYSEGHLPGARHWGWSDLQGFRTGEGRPALAALGLVPGRRVVLYDTGLGMEAAAAFAALDSLGLADHAALLDGQWVKWVSEGRPLCRWTETAESLDPETRSTQVMLSAAEMAPLFVEAARPEPTVTLVDARHMPGGSAWKPFVRIPWAEHLASLYVPILKSEKELRRLWVSVPTRGDHRVIVAARQWTEAAPSYFAARLLGYSVQLLDGSIEDLAASLWTLERGP